MADWWASERTTEPPQVVLVSTEEKRIAVPLASYAAGAGESIVASPLPTAEVVVWRTRLPITPGTPWVVSYESGTKTAYVTIDASDLPVRTPCALVITFKVTSPAGTDDRAVYTMLWVDV